MAELKIKEAIKKSWNWLWHSDSLLSWIVSLLLAFIIVKFIFFPLLSLLLGTSLPLVVVESSSMEHPGNLFKEIFSPQKEFENWWEEKGLWYEDRELTKQEAQSWIFKSGFDKGDIIVVYRPTKLKIGDVIIFEANAQHPIIHRIISIDNKIIETKGDNNLDQLSIEKSISEENIIGKAIFRIPKLGWIKLIFVEIINAFS